MSDSTPRLPSAPPRRHSAPPARRRPSFFRGRAARRSDRVALRPLLEPLEDLTLMASFLVTTLADDGTGSLRAAIAMANDETSHPGADEIRFAPELASGTIDLTTFRNDQTGIFPGPTALVISSAITIVGSGQTVQRSGSENFRLLFVTTTGNLTISDVTLSNGLAKGGSGSGGAAGLGGAVFNQGTLSLRGVTLSGNQAVGGQGIGSLNVDGGGGLGGDAVFGGPPGGPNGGTSGSPNGGFGGGGFYGGNGGFGGGGGKEGNGGFGGGGGLYRGLGGFGGGNGGAGLSSDATTYGGGGGAGLGGAIFNDQGGVLTITNSTLSGNTAQGGPGRGGANAGQNGSGYGGAVFNRNGTVTIRNSTLAGNTVAPGGGNAKPGSAGGGAAYNLLLSGPSASLTLSDSILADSGAGMTDLVNNGGTVSGSFNLVESQSGVPNGVIALTPDPKLGPLQNNGGLTPTMALAPDSPALNAGNNALIPAGLSFDQRGANFPRVFKGTVDLGAFELSNSPPTDIALNPASVPENQPIGTTVGRFTTTDPNTGDTFTYTRVAGTGDDDNNAFTIDADGYLKTNAVFDYEAKSSYSIRVTSTDSGGLTTSKVFTISITNVNETPTDIALSAASVPENAGANAVIGTLSGTDQDAGDTLTFSLPAGLSDNAAFNVSGTTLRANASFDFEAKSSYAVTVRVTDAGGLTFDKTFTVNVNDVNEAPTAISLSNASILENAGANAVIGALSGTDPDAGDSLTFSLPAGLSDNAAFNISGTTLLANASFDFEAKSTYVVTVRATDGGGLTFDRTFTINVTDVNEAPTGIALSSASVAENAGANAIVGTLSGTDPDAGDSLTFSLPAGLSDNAAFNVSGTTLRANASFDFEAKSSYTVTVRVTDAGGLTFDKTFTVNVNDVNEAPTAISLSNASILENAGANAVVGTLSGVDPDAGDSLTFSLPAGLKNNAAFNISGTTLRANASLDFEAKSAYIVIVRATDVGGLTFDRTFIISVTDVNEAPTVTVPSAQTAYEDVAKDIPGVTVGSPVSDRLTVSLSAGHGTLTLRTIGGLTVTGNGTGSVSLSGSIADLNTALASLSYRGNLNYSGGDTLTIKAGDGSMSTWASVAITVRSASQQAADLQAQVAALRTAGVLNKGQANMLITDLNLKGNNGDAGKVQQFLTDVAGLVADRVLTQALADPLLRPGKILLQGVERR